MFLRWSNTYRLGKKTHERTDRVNILRSVEIHELIHRLPGMCVRFCEGSAMIVVFTCLNSGEHARQHESVGGGVRLFWYLQWTHRLVFFTAEWYDQVPDKHCNHMMNAHLRIVCEIEMLKSVLPDTGGISESRNTGKIAPFVLFWQDLKTISSITDTCTKIRKQNYSHL